MILSYSAFQVPNMLSLGPRTLDFRMKAVISCALEGPGRTLKACRTISGETKGQSTGIRLSADPQHELNLHLRKQRSARCCPVYSLTCTSIQIAAFGST